jgi:hypothetical protein
MKKTIVSFCISLTSLISFSQDAGDSVGKVVSHPRIATVETMNMHKYKGWLVKATEDSLIILQSAKKPSAEAIQRFPSIKNPDQYNIAATNINTITTQKNHAVLKCGAIGFVAGSAIGAILGYASGDDKPVQATYTDPLARSIATNINNTFKFTAEEKAVSGAVFGGISGAIAGMIVGALAKKQFIIGGDKQAYKKHRHSLQIQALSQ